MEFESPDVEKDFPGLYASESGGKKSESDFSDDSHDKHKKEVKSKDKKESKKDRGYAALEGESSPDEAEGDIRSPSKSKKSKSFKFPSKKEKREKSREKEGGREAEQQKEGKEKKREKESTRVSKLKGIKDKKLKSKHSEEIAEVLEEPPVFGVPLETAVARSRCHDGIQLPLVVRNCLDFVEECGLTVEGIYKSSGNKSRVQQLRKMYNQKESVNFVDCDPVTVAGLLKTFLRELPEPVISANLATEFEESAGKRGEGLDALLIQLSVEHRELLGWVVMHCKHLVANEKLNKCGGLQGVCATFAPLLQISPKVLSALICYAGSLFPSVHLSRYIPPLSGPSPALPTSEAGCQEELKKLESLLAQVHGEMNAGLAGKRREEQLWDAQRIVTQLKRKLRALQKPLEPRASDDELRMDLTLRQEDDSNNTTSVVPSAPPATSSPPPAPSQSEVVPVVTESGPAEVPNQEIEETSASQEAVESSESQVVPEEKDKNENTNDDRTVPGLSTVHSIETNKEDDSPEDVISEPEEQEQVEEEEEDLEELEQKLIQEQLEILAKQLSERLTAERAEIQKLRTEVAKAQEESKLSSSAAENEELDAEGYAELLKQNKALQAQRDSLFQQIVEEREAIAYTKAMINLKKRNLKLKG